MPKIRSQKLSGIKIHIVKCRIIEVLYYKRQNDYILERILINFGLISIEIILLILEIMEMLFCEIQNPSYEMI